MRNNAVILLSSAVLFSISSLADVGNWRADKGVDYLQTADNTQPLTPTNWYFYSELGTLGSNDATSVELLGGNIAGSIALTKEEDDRWELYIGYPSKAALDAVFPSDADYSLILSGGELGSITQEFSIGTDAYPQVPYLTGADYSTCQALEVGEPLELNWNPPTGSVSYVSLEILEGPLHGDGETVLDFYPLTVFTNEYLPNAFFSAGSNYHGYLQFAHAYFESGNEEFGVDGVIAFNSESLFEIAAVNTAVGYDDFDDLSMNTNKWSITFPPEEAVDLFTEAAGQLEYTSLGTGDTFVAWSWEDGELSYTQDWSIAVDFSDPIAPGTFSGDEEVFSGILVMVDGDLDNNISAEFVNSSSGREAASFVTSGGVENVVEEFTSVTSESISVKISFDADTKMLYSSYSTGGDFSLIASYSASAWGMTDSSVFNPLLFSGNFETEVTNGQVYADNFRMYDGRVLSNEVDLVELEFLHSYGDGPVSHPLFSTNNFLEGNFIKVWSETTHRVRDITFTTSGGFSATVSDRRDDGQILDWEVEIPFGFSTPWNPADDGDWIVTFEFFDGTYQSTIIPFMKEDGVTPLPNFLYSPTFLSPSPTNHSVVSEDTWSFAWAAAGPDVNHLSLDEIFGDSETREITFLYADALPGDSQNIFDLTFDGPLSTTNAGPIVFGEGFHRMRINEGYASAAYNDEGILFIVGKLNEADITFVIQLDGDSDNMDDDWEIEFFGGTNAVDGGANDDFDMDGFSNLEEFIAGVNPTNGNSVFAVEEPGPSPEGFVINWNSVPGREYAVYWAKTLSDGFEPVTPGYLPHPQNSYTDTVHTNQGCGFYYIDVRLEN